MLLCWRLGQGQKQLQCRPIVMHALLSKQDDGRARVHTGLAAGYQVLEGQDRGLLG